LTLFEDFPKGNYTEGPGQKSIWAKCSRGVTRASGLCCCPSCLWWCRSQGFLAAQHPVGVTSYKAIHALTERLLASSLATLDAPAQGELALTQDHPLIRKGDDYDDLFTLCAHLRVILMQSVKKQFWQ
jgi:hypothetical protein